jgi:hypothetical protein
VAKAAALTVVCIALLLLLSGCPPFPHTNDYQPISDWEQREFDEASRDVYPDDVRENLEQYESTVVAWPGIILESTIEEREEDIEVVLLLEHHYYDWLEDYSVQRERIFLSPRGEGLFKTSWSLKKDADLDEIREVSGPGDLAIVYGRPERIEGDMVLVRSTYVRAIDRQWYTTEILDYGRSDETAK